MENGEVTYDKKQVFNSKGRYPIGTVATYTCADGYSLSGSDSNTCEDSGNWETTLPTCNQPGNKINLVLQIYVINTLCFII